MQFRNLSVPTKVRLAELLKHLQVKGEEACHEFYRGLHIHAEDIYFSLPTRVKRRGTSLTLRLYFIAKECRVDTCNSMKPLFSQNFVTSEIIFKTLFCREVNLTVLVGKY